MKLSLPGLHSCTTTSSQNPDEDDVESPKLKSNPDDSGLGSSVNNKLDEKHRDVPRPRRMKKRDLSRASETTMLTWKNDPLYHYMQDTPDYKPSKTRQAVLKVCLKLNVYLYIRQDRAWTIEDGVAFIGFSEPYKQPERSRKDKAIHAIIQRLTRTTRLFDTKEQKRRRKEINTKMAQASEATLGRMKDHMVALDTIATTPEKQGRGYGTALGRIVTDVADAESRDSWLFSSNVEANTAFYNNLGYITVATILVGDNNPTWREKPVPIALMVRTYTPPPEGEEEGVCPQPQKNP